MKINMVHEQITVATHEPSSSVRTFGSWVRIPLEARLCAFFCVRVIFYVGSSLTTGCSSVQGVLPTVFKFKKLKKRPRFTRAVHGSVVGWGTMLQAGRSRDRIPMRSLNFFNWPSSPTMALGSTQPLTEMSTRNILGMFLGVKDGRRVKLTTLPPSMSRLSR
jgi:hypothetical protein